MMGQQPRMESLFCYFCLEDQIPEDHLLRLIDRYVDFRFVRERLKNFSAPRGGPRLIPRCCCACCWWAISTGSPESGAGCQPSTNADLSTTTDFGNCSR